MMGGNVPRRLSPECEAGILLSVALGCLRLPGSREQHIFVGVKFFSCCEEAVSARVSLSVLMSRDA